MTSLKNILNNLLKTINILKMQHHKENKGNKEEPKSKIIEIKENIQEINVQKIKRKKNNSFSYSTKKAKKEIILNEQLYKKKNSQNHPNTKEINKKKQNFILKSEIYNNNNKSIKSDNNLIKECTHNAQLINNYFKYDTNNILRNTQMIQNNDNILDNNSKDNNFNNNNPRNNIYIANNIIQNNPIYYFPPMPYPNYYQSTNSHVNNFYNYNNIRMNPQYSNNYNINNNINDVNNSINNNINNNNINYINLAKTQSGSKMLQEKILLDNNFANDILFPELKNNLNEIITNIFGASLFRVLFKKLRYENLNLFLDLIKDDFNNICLTEAGSHTIQSLIENIHQYPLLLNKFIFYLNNKDIKSIFLSPYGSHIFKYYLTIIKEKEYTNFILNFI